MLLSGAALVLLASVHLTHGLDRLGKLLGISEGLLGLLTALGANAPEIAAAMTALLSGAHDVGYGLVLGSNLFNLAGLLGLSALLIGQIDQDRPGLLLHGTVGVTTTCAVMALVLGWLSPVLTLSLVILVFAAYVALLTLPPLRLRRLPLPGAKALAASLYQEDAGDLEQPGDTPGDWSPVWMVLPALIAIVGGSIEMVHAALSLGRIWHLPTAIIGTLVLAALTGLPNVYAALRLARQGRGGAVVSETLNSNTLNLLVGIAVPAVVFGLGKHGNSSVFAAAFLLALTLVALGLLFWMRRLPRWGGAIVIALYLVFVFVRLKV